VGPPANKIQHFDGYGQLKVTPSKSYKKTCERSEQLGKWIVKAVRNRRVSIYQKSRSKESINRGQKVFKANAIQTSPSKKTTETAIFVPSQTLSEGSWGPNLDDPNPSVHNRAIRDVQKKIRDLFPNVSSFSSIHSASMKEDDLPE